MSSILYYSNFCEHSSRIIQTLSKSTAQSEIHFVCIDRREKMSDGQIALILDNEQKVILPSHVSKVPALLLLNQGYKVIYGDEILSFLQPREERVTQSTPQIETEPSAFSLGDGTGLAGVVSDQFSFLDMTADDLSAKGEGGLRQMHNYATLGEDSKIQTPEEDYVANKASSSDLEAYEAARKLDTPGRGPPLQGVSSTHP